MVEWNPRRAACQYRVFLYDIKINTGDFEDATVIHHSAGATNSAFADIILEGGATHAAGGKAKLRAVAQNRMVFPCPWRATKTLYAAGGGTLDTAYLYREEFNVSSLADGTFSLNLSGLGSEFTFPVGSGALQSQCDAAFYVVNNGSAVTINSVSVAAGKVIRITPSMILGTSTTTQLNFDLGTVSGAVDLYIQAKVKVTDAPPVTKNLNQGRYVKIRTVDAANGANALGVWVYQMSKKLNLFTLLQAIDKMDILMILMIHKITRINLFLTMDREIIYTDTHNLSRKVVVVKTLLTNY